jgi:hypothetical protein
MGLLVGVAYFLLVVEEQFGIVGLVLARTVVAQEQEHICWMAVHLQEGHYRATAHGELWHVQAEQSFVRVMQSGDCMYSPRKKTVYLVAETVEDNH